MQPIAMLYAMVMGMALWSADPPAQPPAFSKTGPQVGDFLPRLKLTGVVDELGEWHPEASGVKLLVTSSYTCPKSRSHYPELRDLARRYKDSVQVVIVYVIEAHPLGDISPYKGVEDVTAENRRDGILFRQPVTFPVRLGLAQSFKQRFDIDMPIYLDGMDNRAWKALGGAPNMGLLVDARGRVLARQDWFDGPAMATNIEKALADHAKRVREFRNAREILESAHIQLSEFDEHHLQRAAQLLDENPRLMQAAWHDDRFNRDWTVLLEAVAYDHQGIVALLLDRGADINTQIMSQHSPLHIAASRYEDGGLDMLDLLIRRGADVDLKGPDGETALDDAAFMGNRACVEALLRAGARQSCFSASALGDMPTLRAQLIADPSRALRPDGQGRTPLDYAARAGQLEAATDLLECGADPGAKHAELYMTPLHWAISGDHIDMLRLLLEREADPDAECAEGTTSIHLAATYDRPAMLALLLDHGAHADGVSGKLVDTPLLTAAANATPACLKVLLDHGASMAAVNRAQSGGCLFRDIPGDETALDLALQKGLVENVRLLIARKFDIKAEKYADAVLYEALRSTREGSTTQDGVREMIAILLDAGAEVNQENQEGLTILDSVDDGSESAPALIALLEAHGGKPGSGAVRDAVEKKNVWRLCRLMAERANSNGADSSGQTALHVIMGPDYDAGEGDDVLKVLLAAKADLNVEDLDGHTPLDLGLRNRKDGLIAILMAHGATTGSGISRRPLGFAPDFGSDSPFYFDASQLDERWSMNR